jgi:hypothetical protein
MEFFNDVLPNDLYLLAGFIIFDISRSENQRWIRARSRED